MFETSFVHQLGDCADEVAGGYAKLTHGRLSMMIAHIPTDELRGFYQACETASCGFSRCFWGRLKVK